MPLGVPELLIILVILLVIFGPRRLPRLGRQLGGGLRELRQAVARDDDPEDDGEDPREPRRSSSSSDAGTPRQTDDA